MGTHFPRWSRAGARRLLPLFPLSLLACQPDLGPLSEVDAPPESPPPPPALSLRVDPPAPLGAAPPVLRLRLPANGQAVDPTRLALAQGAAGPAQLRQVQRGEISKALAERLIPVQRWWEDAEGRWLAAPEEGAALVVAPERALSPGERYALILGDPATIFDLQVAADDPAPLLPRVWPPPGASASDRFGVWCGDGDLPPIAGEMRLSPGGMPGRVQRGLPGSATLGRRCLCFEAPLGPGEDAARLPLPLLSSKEGPIRLDPRPFVADADARPLAPVACSADEQPFGPGCARVSDDRLEVRSPEAPALWAIGGQGLDRVLSTSAGEPFVLAGLPPASPITLQITTLDNAGAATRLLFATSTLPPSPHLIVNEVLANPLGPEPQQEWVELYNDGSLPVDLAGYLLADVGGETSLPEATLAPGAFALIVNEGFVEDDGQDPRPAPGALILHVPKLGHAGLSNAGEPLSLRDAGGAVVSRSPAGPKTKPGMSLSRRAPTTPDLAPAGFALATPSPGAPNRE